MSQVSLIYDPIFLEHDTGRHVENPQRLITTMDLLNNTGLINKLMLLEPAEATIEQIASVHATQYIQ